MTADRFSLTLSSPEGEYIHTVQVERSAADGRGVYVHAPSATLTVRQARDFRRALGRIIRAIEAEQRASDAAPAQGAE